MENCNEREKALLEVIQSKDSEIHSTLSTNMNLQSKIRVLENEKEHFLDLLEDIRISNPDLITLQGIERGNENGISIEGYESVYFCPFDRDLGYATF